MLKIFDLQAKGILSTFLLQKINTKNGESQSTLGALLVRKHDSIYQSKQRQPFNDVANFFCFFYSVFPLPSRLKRMD